MPDTSPGEFIAAVPIAEIDPSKTNPRKTFGKVSIESLADSIRANGVIQPLTIRKNGGKGFELVLGERRLRAATLAKLPTVPALLRTLSDAAAAELQIVENVQREDVHPLEEAEGYERLMAKYGHAPDQIAAISGKSTTYVYGRLRLVALGKPARAAFLAGRINVGLALMLARIPVSKLQDEALEAVAPAGADALGHAAASKLLHERYMLSLERAPFDTASAVLLPKAGSCGPCPKRTGNQAELFPDVKVADTCTDPACFAAKRGAAWMMAVAEATRLGRRVLTDEESGEAFPRHSPEDVDRTRGARARWAEPGQTVVVPGKKGETWEACLKPLPDSLLVLAKDGTGRARTLVDVKAARKAAGKNGIDLPAWPKAIADEKPDATQETADEIGWESAIAKAEADVWGKGALCLMVRAALAIGDDRAFAKRHGIDEKDPGDRWQALDKLIGKADVATLKGMLADALLRAWMDDGTAGTDVRDEIYRVFRVDAKACLKDAKARLKAEADAKDAARAED